MLCSLNIRTFLFISLFTLLTILPSVTKAAATATATATRQDAISPVASNSLVNKEEKTQSTDEGLDVQLALIKSVSSALLADQKIQKRAWTHLSEFVHSKVLPGLRSLIPSDFSIQNVNLVSSLKLAALLLSSLLALSSLLSPVFSGVVLSDSMALGQVRSLTEGVDELTKLNYELLSKSIDSIKSKNFLIELRGPSCHERAICEVGEFVSVRYPKVHEWMEKTLTGALEQFILADQYLLSMLKGLKKHNCTISYNQCTKSPFHTWTEILAKFQ